MLIHRLFKLVDGRPLACFVQSNEEAARLIGHTSHGVRGFGTDYEPLDKRTPGQRLATAGTRAWPPNRPR